MTTNNNTNKIKQWRAIKQEQGWHYISLLVPAELAQRLYKVKQAYKHLHPAEYGNGKLK